MGVFLKEMKVTREYGDPKKYSWFQQNRKEVFLKIHITFNWINEQHWMIPFGGKIWE